MPRLTKEELASRRLGMGATDVVEALGLAPWEGAGPMRVYLAKTEPGDDNADDDRDVLEWGHYMEPVILRWYEASTGFKCDRGTRMNHPKHGWLWATLDASVRGDRNVEVKNVGASMARHWDTYSEDGIPNYVRAQCQIGMACTGVHNTDVVASVAGRPPHVWSVDYDAALADKLIEEAGKFWGMVRARTPPPLDHTSASKVWLCKKYPCNHERVIVEAPTPVDIMGKRRANLAKFARKAKEDMATLDAEIMNAIGERDGIEGDGWKMTWKVGKDGKRRQRFTSGEDSED